MKRNVLLLGIIAIIMSSFVPHLVSIGNSLMSANFARMSNGIGLLRDSIDNQMCLDNGIISSTGTSPLKVGGNILTGIGLTATLILGINMKNYPFMTDEQKERLQQDTRNKIFQLIAENQGIHLREICRSLNKKMGVIQYHIHVLENERLINSIKDGRYRRFFTNSVKLKGHSNKILISFTRRETTSKLLESIYNHNGTGIFHKELANEVGISSQAITWHIKKLLKENIIISEKVGRQKKYYIVDEHIDLLDNLLNDN